MTLGSGIAFIVSFAMVDIINTLCGFIQTTYSTPLIEDTRQILLVVISSCLMGTCFGFMFGFMDVTNEYHYQVKLALMREEKMCYPIGFILGGVVGTLSEYFRYQSEEDLSNRRQTL